MLSDDRQLIETPISDETVFRGALIDVSHMQEPLGVKVISVVPCVIICFSVHSTAEV